MRHYGCRFAVCNNEKRYFAGVFKADKAQYSRNKVILSFITSLRSFEKAVAISAAATILLSLVKST